MHLAPCASSAMLRRVAPLGAAALAVLALSPAPALALRFRGAGGPPPSGALSYRQELENFGDMQYTAEVQVGGQPLRAIPDTGSFDMLAFSSRCATCGRAAKYDSFGSPTYRPGSLQVRHTFGSGQTASYEA